MALLGEKKCDHTDPIHPENQLKKNLKMQIHKYMQKLLNENEKNTSNK